MSSVPATEVKNAGTRRGAICPTCGKLCWDNANLRRHVASRHSEKRYSCNACTKAYGHQSALDRHKREVHARKIFACTKCGASFAKKCLYDKHQRLHGEATTFECDVGECEKTFRTRQLLNAHKKRHTGAIKCAECDVSFKSDFEQRRHMDAKHGAKKHGCERCGKLYAYAFMLKAHQRTCAAVFHCDVDGCDFQTTDYRLFEDHHVEEHEARHKRKCPFCDKWFARLREHEKAVHKGARKYVCACGYAADREDRFASHKERVSARPLDDPRKVAIERRPIQDDFVLDTHADDAGNNLVRKARKRNAPDNGWSFAVKELAIRPVTLKIALSDKSKYLTEAQLMLKLRHKNLMCAWHVYEEPESVLIVMDLVRPGNLLAVAKTLCLSEDDVAYVIRCCADDLKHLHRLGIVHRDMKSDNVLVNEHGVAVVMDFGQSANAGFARYSTVGTYGYTAPEVDDDLHTYALDIWPLPVIATECLARQQVPKFRGNDDAYRAEVYGWIENHQKSLAVSPTFMQFVDACLVLEPTQRISAMDLLQHAFIAIANEQSFASKISHIASSELV